jgi:hypothetical protein
MNTELIDSLRPLLDRLLSRLDEGLKTRPDLRREVADFGAALAVWAGHAPPAPPPPPPPEIVPVVTAHPPPPPIPVYEPPRAPLSQLLANLINPPPVAPPQTHPSQVSAPPSAGDIVPRPLPVIAARCRLKAEAAEYVARRVGGDAEAIVNGPGDLLTRAHAIEDCYLWMLDAGGYSDRPKVWTDLAASFTAAAAAADMLKAWREMPESDAGRIASDVLHLAAEAQAVLFAGCADTGKPKPDLDQLNLFVTIREEAAARRVFVSRYLRKDDPADAARAPDVTRRALALASTLRTSGDRVRDRTKAMSNLKYKAKKLRTDPRSADEWPRVAELLEELVSAGMPPSNADVRDALLPVAEQLPDDVPLGPGATLVFREMDRYLASRPAEDEPANGEHVSAEVAEVRSLLAGKAMILIGGHVRPDRRAALIRAFDLADLDWITTEDHTSVTVFEAPIARPEVAVVLLAIRWSNHSYGDVQEYCEKYGKLLVRLPGGYHPNQAAHQILSQVGHRLRSGG